MRELWDGWTVPVVRAFFEGIYGLVVGLVSWAVRRG